MIMKVKMKLFEKMKFIASGVMIFIFCFFVQNMCQVMAEEFDFEKAIQTLVSSIQQKDWDTYTDLMSYEEQSFCEYYFRNDSYTDGVKQIKTIRLSEIVKIEKEQAISELLPEEYPILENSSDVKIFLVGFDCVVDEENAYFYNGLNYFLIAFAKENDGVYKIAQFNRPSFDFLEENISISLEKSSNAESKKNMALNIVKYAEEGFLINGEGELIIDDYTVIKENIITNKITELKAEEKSMIARANNYSEHPQLDLYIYYSVPERITVKLNKTGTGQIVSVPFEQYIKNTVPNEWMASWNKYTLRAGAYCVKGVAIYRSIKPVNANYMVSQGTQSYKPGTSHSRSDAQVDAIKTKFMVNSSGKIFFPEYGGGSSNDPGTKGSGRLLIYGSEYLGRVKAKKAKGILNYYYKGSSCSSEGIEFITYGII